MKKWLLLLCVLLCLMSLAGCGTQAESEENLFPIYYVSKSETKVEMHQYSLQEKETKGQIEEILRAMATPSPKNEYKAPLAMGFQILDYQMENGKILINMDEKYKELNTIQEVLVRAALVRTLTAHPAVNFVAIRVNNEQLFDSLGNLVGWMNADHFIENDGKEINTYEEVKLKLYFANETGDKLVQVTRTKEYNTNISLEKLIVEELIKGPNAAGIYANINPQTKVANVIVQDGICYVNLDETFLTQVPNVTAEVTIYSIVNSLVQFKNVNKVQISINGDSNLIYRDKFNLADYYEGNEGLIVNNP